MLAGITVKRCTRMKYVYTLFAHVPEQAKNHLKDHAAYMLLIELLTWHHNALE